MILGSAPYQYERVEGWAKIPEYFVLGDVVGVATDSRDRVFVFCRGNHPVLIFDSEGKGVLEVCHDICVDSHSDIYIGEVKDVCRIMKFAKVS